ncbi:hypothetical protein Q7P37_000761 [Cladosporium fusiforme]
MPPLWLTLITLAITSLTQSQTFNLQHSYQGLDFFNRGFTLYEGFDPTFGYVDYVNLATAEAHSLVNLSQVGNSGVARWGVDTKGVLDPNANLGRMSLRLQSVATFTHGLFVLDVKHLPANVCGTWPAFWFVGTGVWPETGEMDIIEQTNNQPVNVMSLHSSAEPNCSVAGTGQSGKLVTNDCAHANSYTGCTVSSNQPTGSAFNAAGGGVFAMLWTSGGMKMWTFQRNAIPASLKNKKKAPLLSEFGAPVANFQGSCDFDAHFNYQMMIFNTDFCGSNAGNTFQMHGCPMATGQSWESCNIYVANNPQAFVESYWEVNYLDVYDIVGSAAVQGSGPVPVDGESTSYAGAAWPTSWTAPAPFTTSATTATTSQAASSSAGHLEPEPTTVDMRPGVTMRVGPPPHP